MMFASKEARNLAPGCTCGRCDWACRFALARPCCGMCGAASDDDYDPPQHNEPNPILVSFRTSDDTRDPAEWLDYSESAYMGPSEHLDHARRVLIRLANLTEGASA